jgi:hypothetical protein
VNASGLEAGNELITADVDLPWLQDEAAVDAWTAWGVTWRDVIILDRQNVVFAVENLTVHSLADPAHREELKALLRAAGQR